MSLPSRPDAQQPVSADAIARHIEETRARTVTGGKVALVQHRGGGIVLARPARGLHPAPRIAYGSNCPFAMAITSTGTTRTITFRPGTINSMLPSNYLSGVEVPESGTRYIVLDVTVTSGEVTAAAFAADESAPPAIAPMAGEPPTAFKILIGLCIDAKPFRVWGCGNIQALPVEAFRLDKASPVAGLLPYDVYYTWDLAVL